jgi:glutathione S-transferase
LQDPIIRGNKTSISDEDKAGADEIYGFLEAFLDGNNWIGADSVSVADYSLVSSVSSLQVLVPIDAETYPKVAMWFRNCESLPEYGANKIGLEVFTDVIKNKLQ